MLSIIIPCYNAANTLPVTLAAVDKQICRNFELILVNDGSTDNTSAILHEYAYKRDGVRVIEQSHKGVSFARNAGIEVARGDYLFFLDADDVISENLVEEVLSVPDCEMLLFGFHYERKLQSQTCIPLNSSNYLKDYLSGRNLIHICSFVVSRRFINRFQIHFNESSHFGEDHEFIVQCLLHTANIKVLPKILFSYCYNLRSVMHTKNYDDLYFTSVESWKGIYNNLVYCSPQHAPYALVRYQLAIILFAKGLARSGNTPNKNLVEKLNNHREILRLNSHVYWNKYAAYVQIMRLLYKL